MHIPDGLLDVRTWVGCWGIAAGGLAVAVRRVNRRIGEEWLPLAGVMGAFLFVAQMINFPIGGGTSGHLVGSALAAIVLGPALGAVVLAAVLTIQALVFQDGGIASLGANIVNMALVGSISGYLIYRVTGLLQVPERVRVAAGGFIAGWASIVLAAALCSFEMAFSGVFPFRVTFVAMTSVHAAIGIGEGIITAGMLYFILTVKPHVLIPQTKARVKPIELVGLGLLLLGSIALVAPLASTAPDGLEKTIETLGGKQLLATAPLYETLPDYEVPGIRSSYLSTALSGLIGVFIVLVITYAVAKVRSGKKASRTQNLTP